VLVHPGINKQTFVWNCKWVSTTGSLSATAAMGFSLDRAVYYCVYRQGHCESDRNWNRNWNRNFKNNPRHHYIVGYTCMVWVHSAVCRLTSNVPTRPCLPTSVMTSSDDILHMVTTLSNTACK